MWMIFLYEIGDLLVNPPAVSPSVEDPRNGENALMVIRVSSNLFINRDINASSGPLVVAEITAAFLPSFIKIAQLQLLPQYW